MKKVLSFILFCFFLIEPFIGFNFVYAYSFDTSRNSCSVNSETGLAYEVSIAKSDNTFEKISCHSDYDSAKTAMNNHDSDKDNVAVVIETKYIGNEVVSEIVNAKYGVVNLATKGSYKYNTNLYSDTETQFNGYVNGYYGNDAALLDVDVNISINDKKIKYFTVVADIPINIRPIVNGVVGESIGSVVQGETFEILEELGIIGGYYRYKINKNGVIGYVADPGGWLTFSTSNKYDIDKKARIKISGYTGWVNKYDTVGRLNYEIIPISQFNLNTYYGKNSNDEIFHKYRYFKTSFPVSVLGPGPSFMQKDVKYYSFDSNYFYTDYLKMIDDYKLGNYNNSINKDNPYYNYYMYLPNRNKSGYTADDINQLLKAKNLTSKPNPDVTYYDSLGNSLTSIEANMSVLVDEGPSFINSQNLYGVNAFQTFSLAVNESGWGKSPISIGKNNIFGHGAIDSSPYESATTYLSVSDSITAHASGYVTSYSSPSDSRYHGGHYGNKGSGMGVKYASDPYWGEKQASNYYYSDKSYGLNDYEANIIGIKNVFSSVRIRKTPKIENNNIIYEMKNKSYNVKNMSVNIIDIVKGEDVYNDGNDLWYKIQTDPSLDDNQNIISSSLYNWDISIGYVHSSLLYVDRAVISAKDISATREVVPNYLKDVSAYDSNDGIITDNITVDSSNVDINTKGVYPVYYLVSNSNNKITKKMVNVIVSGNSIPVINGSNKSYLKGTDYNLLDNITASDIEDGNITNLIEVDKKDFDIDKVGEYTVRYSVTDSDNNTVFKDIKVSVLSNTKPVINADDKSFIQSESFDLLSGVTASDIEDGNITSIITIDSNNFDINKPGIYSVTYRVIDSNLNTTIKTINVTVVPNGKPVITASDLIIPKGVNKNFLEGVSASDDIDGDITDDIVIEESNVDISKLGVYQITYSVVDSEGKKGVKSIRVEVRSNNLPVILGDDIYISINQVIDIKNYVTASDIEDGDLNDRIVIDTSYDKSKSGVYDILYSVVDNDNNKVIKNVKIHVENNYIKKNGEFYFERFLYNDDTNKFNFVGYLTIDNMNNTLTQNIKYDFILEDVNSLKKYVFNIDRWTDVSKYPFRIPSHDGFKFDNAWFNGDVDLSKVPKGDYKTYIRARSKDFEVVSVISNVFLKPMSSRVNESSRGYQIRTDFGVRDLPMEIFIRDDNLISNKVNPTVTNMFNFYDTINISDGLLKIKGGSYSVGVDYSNKINVERYIYLENNKTFDRIKSLNIGYIDNGPYNITLRYNDGFSKLRGWYNGSIDINNLEVGIYTIYINTITNLSNDYGELTDIFIKNIESTYSYNGKKYSLIVNKDKRFRVELKVESK